MKWEFLNSKDLNKKPLLFTFTIASKSQNSSLKYPRFLQTDVIAATCS